MKTKLLNAARMGEDRTRIINDRLEKTSKRVAVT